VHSARGQKRRVAETTNAAYHWRKISLTRTYKMKFSHFKTNDAFITSIAMMAIHDPSVATTVTKANASSRHEVHRSIIQTT
jgi:pterin-4a-carbinolamine dehydratase